MFTFGQDETRTLCKEILELHDILPEAWDHVYKTHLAAKGPLYGAIGPTGRIEMPASVEVQPGKRFSAYGRAIDQIKNNGLSHVETTPGGLVRSMIPLERNEKIALDHLKAYFPKDWINHGSIGAGKELLTSVPGAKAKIRKGQKLTRAVAAYLRACEVSEKQAARLADEIMRQAYIQPADGTLVLSVNAVDILLTGEQGSLTTCHHLNGGHRSGNFQYLIDAQTAVAYFYRELREYKQANGELDGVIDIKLPFKLWRQLVVFDPRHHSIGFLRHYPDTLLLDEQHRKIRQAAAGIMGKIIGKADREWNVVVHASEEYKGFCKTAANNAYPDYVTLVMHTGTWEDATLILPKPLCPMCGKDPSFPSDQLACTPCRLKLKPCRHCATPTMRDPEAQDAQRDGYMVCGKCIKTEYHSCAQCPSLVRNGQETMVHGRDLCTVCFEKDHCFCAYCGAPELKADATKMRSGGYLCGRCVVRQAKMCPICNSATYPADMTGLRDGTREPICRWCSLTQRREKEAAITKAWVETRQTTTVTTTGTPTTSTTATSLRRDDPEA